MSALLHPSHPESFRHWCTGCLLLLHLFSHYLLPESPNEWPKGKTIFFHILSLHPLWFNLYVEISGKCWQHRIKGICCFSSFAGEFHSRSHFWVSTFNCYHLCQLHYPSTFLFYHQLWGLFSCFWDPLHSYEVKWSLVFWPAYS